MKAMWTRAVLVVMLLLVNNVILPYTEAKPTDLKNGTGNSVTGGAATSNTQAAGISETENSVTGGAATSNTQAAGRSGAGNGDEGAMPLKFFQSLKPDQLRLLTSNEKQRLAPKAKNDEGGPQTSTQAGNEGGSSNPTEAPSTQNTASITPALPSPSPGTTDSVQPQYDSTTPDPKSTSTEKGIEEAEDGGVSLKPASVQESSTSTTPPVPAVTESVDPGNVTASPDPESTSAEKDMEDEANVSVTGNPGSEPDTGSTPPTSPYPGTSDLVDPPHVSAIPDQETPSDDNSIEDEANDGVSGDPGSFQGTVSTTPPPPYSSKTELVDPQYDATTPDPKSTSAVNEKEDVGKDYIPGKPWADQDTASTTTPLPRTDTMDPVDPGFPPTVQPFDHSSLEIKKGGIEFTGTISGRLTYRVYPDEGTSRQNTGDHGPSVQPGLVNIVQSPTGRGHIVTPLLTNGTPIHQFDLFPLSIASIVRDYLKPENGLRDDGSESTFSESFVNLPFQDDVVFVPVNSPTLHSPSETGGTATNVDDPDDEDYIRDAIQTDQANHADAGQQPISDVVPLASILQSLLQTVGTASDEGYLYADNYGGKESYMDKSSKNIDGTNKKLQANPEALPFPSLRLLPHYESILQTHSTSPFDSKYWNNDGTLKQNTLFELVD